MSDHELIDGEPRRRPKIKKRRLLSVLSGLGLLAGVSTVFGMMMAVASDLPRIEVLDVAQHPSTIVDRYGQKLGTLTSNQNRILVKSSQIAPVVRHAVVAIEDRRFYTNSGIDVRGIGRALYQDVVSGQVVQGGSTIAQQLVKNRLEAQSDRTLFQKAREAAIAFHMTRNWDKDKILTNYLNTIYFGNGAYGIEAAAKTYFGRLHGFIPGTTTDCAGRTCASQLEPHEAALLAGIIASPTGYDPLAHPVAATNRRNLVLHRMLDQNFLTHPEYETAILEAVPTQGDIEPPKEDSKYPYFTTWVRQQVVDKVGANLAFEGDLRVKTTIDPELQEAAQQAVYQISAQYGGQIGYDGMRPAAALVALDNDTSEVLAMVGGGPLTKGDTVGGFNQRPFNLATQGQRQPGSAFKPFILTEALRQGISPNQTYTSKQKTFCVVKKKDGNCKEAFEVNNYEDAYSGVSTLARATTFSDNSVFAEVGINVGTKKIARLARRMGIRTPVSTNMAMTLGGLKEGVSVLDMAHAYETLAKKGKLVYGTLSPGVERVGEKNAAVPGPVGIKEIVQDKKGEKPKTVELTAGGKARNRTVPDTRVFPEAIGNQVEGILQGVVKFGTARRASLGPKIPVAGKTGTTEDYGDAWFVGWTPNYTIAVWVGFPDNVKSMKPPLVHFGGEPVAGGTFPAAIWQAFAKRAEEIRAERDAKKKLKDGPTGPTGATGAIGPATTAPETTTAPEATTAPSKKKRPDQQQEQTPAEEQPTEPAPANPEPTQAGQDPGASGGAGAPSGDGTAPPADEAGTAPE